MLLIDHDTKPQNTILYISAQLIEIIKEKKKINIALLDKIFTEIYPKQPIYKYQLSLNFLFLLDKIAIENGEIIYVP